MKKIYMIGNTHFDPVWLWKWDEAMSSVTATFRSALERMEEYPEFKYSFMTPPVLEWIKKTSPEMFEEIKKRIAEGRWEIAEGWWVQPDCYSASGESYVRQGLYGQRYLMKNFGKYAKTVFNIDSFGHSIMLPQIMSKSNIENYVFVRPEDEHITLDSDFFWWESPDGSRVKAYRVTKPYDYGINTALSGADKGDGDRMLVYGVTDHGGAPTKLALDEIRKNKYAHCSFVECFFNDHIPENVFKNELITGDFGPYANITNIKSMNRLAEYSVLNAEKASVIAQEPGNKESITKCWHDILFNQFHDILGGACIKDAYSDAYNMYGRAISTANEIVHYSLLKITNNIRMPGTNPENIWNIVVWNLNALEYDGYIEAEVQWAHEFPWYDKGIALSDKDNNCYDCQIIREKSVIPGFRSRILFKAKLPSLGYRSFKLIRTGEEIPCGHNTYDNKIETDRYEFVLDKNTGGIKYVFDRKEGKLLYSGLMCPECYEDNGDTWAFNTEAYGSEAERFELKACKVIEDGIHRIIVKGTYIFRNSLLDIYYIFYKKEGYFDIKYKVNWNEKHIVLKFMTDIKNDKHIASTPYGCVNRTADKRDIPVSEWIRADSLTFVLNNIFAYNIRDGKLGLTVLRSPIYGDLRLKEIDPEIDYDITEQGIKEGYIRVYIEENDRIEKDSILFNNPPVVMCEACHDGDLDPDNSYLGYESEQIIISTVKFCEDDNSIIIRGYESKGSAEKFSFLFCGHKYCVDVSAFEIFTLRIHNGNCSKVNMLEDVLPDNENLI